MNPSRSAAATVLALDRYRIDRILIGIAAQRLLSRQPVRQAQIDMSAGQRRRQMLAARMAIREHAHSVGDIAHGADVHLHNDARGQRNNSRA
jgi:hypothetical protein